MKNTLQNLQLQHGKVTGSNRLMYPLENDPRMSRRLYWGEEFDEEFLQLNGNSNNKKTENMNTNAKLNGFTPGAPTSQPYSNADGGTDYSTYGNVANQTISLLQNWFPGKNKNNQTPNNPPPPAYTPPPSDKKPDTDQGMGIGTKIAIGVGGVLVLVGVIFGIRALVNRGKAAAPAAA